MDAVSKDELAKALDILVMRLQALQRAKAKGGKWETASRIELIADSAAELAPTGLSALLS